MQLETGDCIEREGLAQLVFAANETHVRIATTATLIPTIIKREQNEIFLIDKPRLTEAERASRMKQFLATAGSAAQELTKEILPNEKETTMKKKSGTKKAATEPKKKGATAKQANAAGDPTASRGGLGNVMGYSVSSVIRALGKHGLDADQIDRALKAQGVTADPKTIRVSIRKVVLEDTTKKFAPLTKEQLATLVKDGGEAAAPATK